MNQKVFRRDIVFCFDGQGVVNGHYRCGDIFQLIPVSNTPEMPSYARHQPFILEYGSEKPDEPIMIPTHEGEKALPESVAPFLAGRDKLNEILNLLTVLTNYWFFVYSDMDYAWFAVDPSKEARWGRKIFWAAELDNHIIDGFSNPEGSLVPIVSAEGYYDLFSSDSMEFPDILDDGFRKHATLSQRAKQAYNSACYLFQKGIEIGWQSHSLSYASFISSIETMVASENTGATIEICEECGQRRRRTTKQFKEFIRKHHGKPATIPRKKWNEYVGKLYDVRSKILHEGRILLSDLSPLLQFDNTQEYDRQIQISMMLRKIAQLCLINWLFGHS